MSEYHKINTLFKRDDKTNRLIVGEFCDPAIEYLACNQWAWTEKVDGTNIRVIWDGVRLRWGGRTDNAQIPATLIEALENMFVPPSETRISIFAHTNCVLYGEGYGAKIQKGGGNYRQDQSFVLFDVAIGGLFLERANVEDIGKALGIQTVPIIGQGTLLEAVGKTQAGFQSTWGNFTAEGIVARPLTELCDRRGHRIITKIKHRDFKEGK